MQANGLTVEPVGFETLRDMTLPANPSFDWAERRAKRGIASTYVWTAGGAAIAEELALAGCAIALVDQPSNDAIDTTAERIAAHGVKVLPLRR